MGSTSTATSTSTTAVKVKAQVDVNRPDLEDAHGLRASGRVARELRSCGEGLSASSRPRGP